MYFYGYRQHQPHAFVNKLNYIKTIYILVIKISWSKQLINIEGFTGHCFKYISTSNFSLTSNVAANIHDVLNI